MNNYLCRSAAPVAGGDSLVRSYEALIDDVQPGERTVVARINTRAVDRYKSVIEPTGVKLDAYRKNPIVLWEHGDDPVRGRVPIGKNLWIKARRQEGDILAKTKFADDEFSRGLFQLYQDGTLRGFSLNGGSEATAVKSAPTAAEIRARPELADCARIYRSCDMCEYSAVAVPGNPEALALAVSRGLWVPDVVRSALPAVAAVADDDEDLADLPPLPDRPDLPALAGRRLTEVMAARRTVVRAYLQAQADDLKAIVDLRRGVV
jgi:hypothetical protein